MSFRSSVRYTNDVAKVVFLAGGDGLYDSDRRTADTTSEVLEFSSRATYEHGAEMYVYVRYTDGKVKLSRL